VYANVDLLAPKVTVEATEEGCPGGERPAVGFEFMTDEAMDDEDISGAPGGFTDDEEAALDAMRARREAAVERLRADGFPYVVRTGPYWDESDKSRAEQLVRDTVQALFDDLRADGLL
jgi:hypothetical protein